MILHHNFSQSKPAGPIPTGFFFMDRRPEELVNAAGKKSGLASVCGFGRC